MRGDRLRHFTPILNSPEASLGGKWAAAPGDLLVDRLPTMGGVVICGLAVRAPPHSAARAFSAIQAGSGSASEAVGLAFLEPLSQCDSRSR